MITQIELNDMQRIAENNPGLKDLIDQAYEYYLLNRTDAPTVQRTAEDIIRMIKERKLQR